MGFYEDFIEKYDKLITWRNRAKREKDFYKQLFVDNHVRSILDCACGTGQHVIMFNKMKYLAKGSDLSASMIKKARDNAKKEGINPSFRIADFRKLSKTFNEPFDAINCVGNSLPHLLADGDLSKALSEMYKLLNKDGILILQERNYDMLVKLKKRFMPITIKKDEVFFYVLDYYPNKITFNVIDLNLKSGELDTYTCNYNPLTKKKLVGLLRDAGFRDIRLYGNYKFRRFDIKNDDYLLITCKK